MGSESPFQEDAGDNESYGCVLPFDCDDLEFRRGFEVGNIWGHLQSPDGEREFMAHADCTEMLMRMGEAMDMEFNAATPCDGWVFVRYGAAAQQAREAGIA